MSIRQPIAKANSGANLLVSRASRTTIFPPPTTDRVPHCGRAPLRRAELPPFRVASEWPDVLAHPPMTDG